MEYMEIIYILLFIKGCLGVNERHRFMNEDEFRLVMDLTVDYKSEIKPSTPGNAALNVTFDVALAQIIDLDEKNQILTTNVWLNQMWLDSKLQWDSRKYGGIKEIRIPYEMVWRPDIVLYNSAHLTSESVSTNVIVTHEGLVMWLSMVIFKSSCDIDVKYFPFDTQRCTLDFSSWTYDAAGLDLQTLQPTNKGDVSNYKNSTEWHLIDYITEREVVKFSCCPVPYIFIKNYIHIRRRPLFYVFNMVFPCILITLVALLGFYMPSDSGEKISMGITTLLSMTVFLMIVADKMPPTSEDLPLVGVYYGVTIAIVSSATAMTVFVLNIHHKGVRGSEVPKWMKRIFFGVMAKILFIHLDLDEEPPSSPKPGMQQVPQSDHFARYDIDRRPENGGVSPRFSRKFAPPSTPSSDNTERQFMRVLQKVYQTIEKNEMRLEDQDRREAIRNEWQQLALVIDRMLLIFFIVLTAAITLALILPGYYSQSEQGQETNATQT